MSACGAPEASQRCMCWLMTLAYSASGRICSEEDGAGTETLRAAPAKLTPPAGVEGREGVEEREEVEEPPFRLCWASLCPASCDLLSA